MRTTWSITNESKPQYAKKNLDKWVCKNSNFQHERQSQLSNKRGKNLSNATPTWRNMSARRVQSRCATPTGIGMLFASYHHMPFHLLPSLPSFSPQSLCSLSSYFYIPAQLNDDYCNISKASSDISGKSLNYPDYQLLPMKIIRLSARFQVRWIIRVTIGDFEVHPGAYTNLSAHICALINPW